MDLQPLDLLAQRRGVGQERRRHDERAQRGLAARGRAAEQVAAQERAAGEDLDMACLVGSLEGEQLLDSLAVDSEDHVCVATIRNGGVTDIAPDGTFTHVPAGDGLTTNVCFGGPDMRTAYGVGLTVHTPTSTITRISVARSGEGTRVIFSFSPNF